MFERGGEEGVAGDEGDDEFGRVVELLPVRLLRQRVDVGAQLPGVGHEVRPPDGFVGGVVGVEERLQRHLGVDHHVPGARQMHDHVGAHPAVGAVLGHLLLEVAVLDHAGHLDHAPQLHLPPSATRSRGAQSRDQVAGLGLQLVLGLGERPHLLAQPGVGLLTLELEEPQAVLVAAELFAQGGEELLDGLGALVEVTARRLLGMGQAGVGELQELRVVLLERLARQLGDFPYELAPAHLVARRLAARRPRPRSWSSSAPGASTPRRRAEPERLGVVLTLGGHPGRRASRRRPGGDGDTTAPGPRWPNEADDQASTTIRSPCSEGARGRA